MWSFLLTPGIIITNTGAVRKYVFSVADGC